MRPFNFISTDRQPPLGTAPEHLWPRERLRFLATFNPSRSEISDETSSLEVSFVPMDAIGEDGTLRLDEKCRVSEISQGYTFFSDGDVVIAKITPCFENGKGALASGLLNGKAFGTTELIVVRPIAGRSCAHFLKWVFSSPDFRFPATAAMYGAGGQKRVPESFVKNFEIGRPSIEEQQAIAAFLARETTKIDSLIAEQERLIGLLDEKRQAVISHAVTKGLDPIAPTQDSDLAWLVFTPSHWEIVPLKSITQEKCDGPFGSGLKSDHYTATGVRVIRLQNIKGMAFDTSDEAYIDGDYFNSELLRHAVRAGDLLVAGLGDDRNTVGRSCVAPAGIEPAMVKADCFRFRLNPARARSAFVAAQLTVSSRHDAGVLSNGSTRSRIPLLTMASRFIALPPLPEQDCILAHLQAENDKVDVALEAVKQSIALLQERRSAIISAAVRGKIDVRSLAEQDRHIAAAAE